MRARCVVRHIFLGQTRSRFWTRRRGRGPLLGHVKEDAIHSLNTSSTQNIKQKHNISNKITKFQTKSQTNKLNKKLYKNLKKIHFNLEKEKKKLGTNIIFFPLKDS